MPICGVFVAVVVKVEPLSTFTLNASRSYNLLYFIYARKASQMLLRNLRKIYATVEIHLKKWKPYLLSLAILATVSQFDLMYFFQNKLVITVSIMIINQQMIIE